nr:radical SAM protein [uncultured Sellimonas sp.]
MTSESRFFDLYQDCTLCPRMCHVDRTAKTGFCGCTSELSAARAALHFWEEPCITGNGGSGTVFFSGCTLKCCFCQNYPISCEGLGKTVSVSRLAEIFLNLQKQGAENISLVTATQHLPSILPALDMVKDSLHIPVVYNCGGYERTETLDLLNGYVDIYLPDLKYYNNETAWKYSRADNYFSYASTAVKKMVEQVGPPVLNEHGVMTKGVIIRHMILPGQKEDSIRLLQWMADALPENSFYLSLMSQYTPFYHADRYPQINRRITTYEYNKVLDKAILLGLTNGYMQEKSSAKEEYTPPFDFEGI